VAEPLKNSYGTDIPERIADMIAAVYPGFDRDAFMAEALAGYNALELTARARQIANALGRVLPMDRQRAIEIVITSLGPEIGESELKGLGPFIYLPHVFFVAEHGLDAYDTAMQAQYELTKRFTAEFSIRVFLERHPEETLVRLRAWANDPNVHVRRLVSEGSRPRLPWAPRLQRFQKDPGPVLELLELLKDDPEEYVRRSVANNLNDIAKDHPDRVVRVARDWWNGASHDRRRLVRHALRTLVKAGHPGALAILGYGADSPVLVRQATCQPPRVEIGGKVRIEVELHNPTDREAGVLADLRVHFVKANGSRSAKVFKGGEAVLGPGERTTIRKTVSVAQHSTRTHYPGEHAVEIMLNGRVLPGPVFEVV
jgi:3-methyladenine DNA glycosylase AlkC